MPRSHPMHPVVVGRNPCPGGFNLAPEAYRPVADRNRLPRPLPHLLSEALRLQDDGRPDLTRSLVKGRENLAPLRVHDRQNRDRGVASGREGAQRRDSAEADLARLRKAACRGDADPQPGESAGTRSHGDPADGCPSACIRKRLLHRGQQIARVPRPPGLVGPDRPLGQDFAPRRHGDAELRRRRVDSENVVHEGERTVSAVDAQTMGRGPMPPEPPSRS